MYFTVNLGFLNYFDNWTNSLETSVLLNWTTHEQILSIYLYYFALELDLLKSPKM